MRNDVSQEYTISLETRSQVHTNREVFEDRFYLFLYFILIGKLTAQKKN